MSTYIPGVCNIGKAERSMRLRFGIVAAVVTVALWLVFDLAGLPPWSKIFLVLPAGGAAAGFFQAAFHFCANFGMRGVFNFGDNVGKTDTVEQAEFRRKDMQKARLILGLSALSSVVVAAIAYFV